jgi:hypothetical protein
LSPHKDKEEVPGMTPIPTEVVITRMEGEDLGILVGDGIVCRFSEAVVAPYIGNGSECCPRN